MKHHVAPTFIASRENEAQFCVALSLYRFDRIRSVLTGVVATPSEYLARSATQIRYWNSDASVETLEAAKRSNDPHLVYVLTESGPQYWLRNKAIDCTRINLRTHYTSGFEDMLIGLAIATQGKYGAIVDRLYNQWSNQGTSPFLLCRRDCLRDIMAHVFSAPESVVQKAIHALMDDAVDRGEFTALTHDGSFKTLFSILGQENMSQKKGNLTFYTR